MTFAAMNRLVKTTLPAVGLWKAILDAVPRSRLMVLVGARSDEQALGRELFGRLGIGGDRLLLVGRSARADYLAQYARADVALDTFPYCGHTTTCDALWMGVPVVTLAGATHVSRAGASVLSAAGLEEFVAATPGDYVARAAALSRSPHRLAELRRQLRPRMKNSPITDGAGLTRRLEQAFRWMWDARETGNECRSSCEL